MSKPPVYSCTTVKYHGRVDTYFIACVRAGGACHMAFDPASAALRLDGCTSTLLIGLTLVGAASRLWNLHLPATPVYDETHVGRFLNWYHDGTYFFDVHGPLARLLMLWSARATGFEGRASCPYEDSAPYAAASGCQLAPQRLVPALCGACMVPITFATCCVMRLHPVCAVLCSLCVLIDPLWLGLSRLHLNDMVLMLFIGLTHLLALRACRPLQTAGSGLGDASKGGADEQPETRDVGTADSDNHEASERRPDSSATGRPTTTIETTALLAMTGAALGCALQCKYAAALTTLAWLGLQNVHALTHLAAAHGVRTAVLSAGLRGVLLLGLPLAIHVALFALHLSYVPHSGNGDNYMSAAFQSTLVGSSHEVAFPVDSRPGLLGLALEHARAQFRYNRNMAILFPRGSHPFDSAWCAVDRSAAHRSHHPGTITLPTPSHPWPLQPPDEYPPELTHLLARSWVLQVHVAHCVQGRLLQPDS